MKPRKVSVSCKVDDFLEREGLLPKDEPQSKAEGPSSQKEIRPDVKNVNTICCAACGQVEYLSREYCCCGHFLRGQLEDAYLAWERELWEDHERVAQDAEWRLRRLRWVFLAAAPFFLVPIITALYVPEMSLAMFLWMILGIVIIGGAALAEKWILRHKVESMALLDAANLDTFVLVRNV